MEIKSGLIKIKDYEELVASNFFTGILGVSESFLEKNDVFLSSYMSKWVSNPLKQWSRQYEYPFVSSFLKHGMKVLDAGSGVTFFPYFLKKRGVDVCSCDMDPILAEIYENINSLSSEKVDFSLSDIRKMPYEDAGFDAVYCVSVLEHTKNFEEIIEEFARVLKKGGCLILTFDVSLDELSDISKKGAYKLLDSVIKSFDFLGDKDFLSLESLKDKSTLTSRYVGKKDKALLPWKYPKLKYLYDLKTLRLPKALGKNLACFNGVFVKK